MNVVVGAIPGRKGSSNFMSTTTVSYDGKMPPRLATFKNSYPTTPKAANPAIALCVWRRKKSYCHRAVLVCTAKGKKINWVCRRPRQPARHLAARGCDRPCRSLPRQGVWARTTTIALVRR